MISKCCGEYLARLTDNEHEFVKICLKCKRTYKQRKRGPK